MVELPAPFVATPDEVNTLLGPISEANGLEREGLLRDRQDCVSNVLQPTLGDLSPDDDDCILICETRAPLNAKQLTKVIKEPAIYAETLSQFSELGQEHMARDGNQNAKEAEWRKQVEFYMSCAGCKLHAKWHQDALRRDGRLPLEEIITWPRMVQNGAQSAGPEAVAQALRQSSLLKVSDVAPLLVGPVNTAVLFSEPLKEPAIYAETLKEFGRLGDERKFVQECANHTTTVVEQSCLGGGLDATTVNEPVKEPAIYAETLRDFGRIGCERKPSVQAPNSVCNEPSIYAGVCKEPSIYAGTLKQYGRASGTGRQAYQLEEKNASRPPLMCWFVNSALGKRGRLLGVLCQNEKAVCFQSALSWCQTLLEINSTTKDISYDLSDHSHHSGLHSAVRKSLLNATGHWARIAPDINIMMASSKGLHAIGLGWNKRQVQRAACLSLALSAISGKQGVDAASLHSLHCVASLAPCFKLGSVLPDENVPAHVHESLTTHSRKVRNTEAYSNPPMDADHSLVSSLQIPGKYSVSQACSAALDNSSSDEELDDFAKARARIIQDADNIAAGKRRHRDSDSDEEAGVQRSLPSRGRVVDVARPITSSSDGAARYALRRAMRQKIGHGRA